MPSSSIHWLLNWLRMMQLCLRLSMKYGFVAVRDVPSAINNLISLANSVDLCFWERCQERVDGLLQSSHYDIRWAHAHEPVTWGRDDATWEAEHRSLLVAGTCRERPLLLGDAHAARIGGLGSKRLRMIIQCVSERQVCLHQHTNRHGPVPSQFLITVYKRNVQYLVGQMDSIKTLPSYSPI